MENKETVGIFLKRKRLEKGLSLEQVKDSTKINLFVLKKIEEDDSSDILKGVHFKGFVINLCELYEVDQNEAIKLFEGKVEPKKIKKTVDVLSKNKNTLETVEEEEEKERSEEKENKIVEESKKTLKEKSKRFNYKKYLNFKTLYFALFIFFLIFISIYFFSNKKEKQVKEEEKRNVYVMNAAQGGYDLKKMDIVRLFWEVKYKIFLLKDYHDDTIYFSVEDGSYELKEGTSLKLDFNNDQKDDLEISFKKGNGDLVYVLFNFLSKEVTIDYDRIWEEQPKILVGYEYQLLEYVDKTPITVYIKAGSLSSYITYIADGSRQSSFTISPHEGTTIVAEDILEITIGNYKSVHFFVNKIPLNLKLEYDKFSVTKIIKWIKDPNNETKSNLMIKDYVEKKDE